MLLFSFLELNLLSVLAFQVQLYGGLLLFCGFVLYDTQLIVSKCTRGDRDFVWYVVIT